MCYPDCGMVHIKDPPIHRTMSERSSHGATSRSYYELISNVTNTAQCSMLLVSWPVFDEERDVAPW